MSLFSKKKLKLFFEILFLILFIFFIIMDAILRKRVYAINFKWTLDMQSYNSSNLTRFFYFMSLIGSGPTVAGILIFYFFLSSKKAESLALLGYTSLLISLNSYLKLLYHDPRPYFLYKKIQVKWKSTSFGNPSGHAMFAIFIFFIFQNSLREYITEKLNMNKTDLEQINNIGIEDNTLEKNLINKKSTSNNEENKNDKRKKNINIFIDIVIIFLYIFIVFSIGLSRIYLGVHSIDQIMLGYVYGLFSLYLYYLYFFKHLKNLLINCADSEFREKFKRKIIFIILSIFIVFNIVSILIFYLMDNYFIVPLSWEKSLSLIGVNSNSPNFLYNKNFIESGIFSMFFGIYFAAIITKGHYSEGDYNIHYRDLRFAKKFLRFLALLIIGIIAIIFNYFTGKIKNIYLNFMFKYNLPGFCFGIILVSILPQIYSKFKIDVKGDYMKCESD